MDKRIMQQLKRQRDERYRDPRFHRHHMMDDRAGK